jgi:putative hydrolase of HD superfamily
MPPAYIPGLSRLAEAAGKLKRVRRKGWVDRGVVDAESVADHSYRLALLAWAVASGRGLDADRALRIALFHDLAEADVGDATPFDAALAAGGFDRARFDAPAPRDEARRAAKHAREMVAIEALAGALGAELGDELRTLVREYEQQASPEARLVKELDRVETLLQAEEYRAEQPELPVGSFRHEVESRGLAPDLVGLFRRHG